MLRRPDVFHAAVAGAPVTDWRAVRHPLHGALPRRPDTTRRPTTRNSLSPTRPKLERPLLLVHGLADDNVVAAHTLRLSSALLAAGGRTGAAAVRRHAHDPQEVVAENLLLLQVRFLKESLA